VYEQSIYLMPYHLTTRDALHYRDKHHAYTADLANLHSSPSKQGMEKQKRER